MTEPSLKLVGYWHGPFDDAEWPHPSDFVDAAWEREDRPRIVRYLQSGARVHEDLGFSHCRFEGGPSDDAMGNAELTDGTWVWPEGLSVYVGRYSVRLPDDFIAHMRRNAFKIPSGLNADELEAKSVDFDYWRVWCETNRKGR